MNHNTYKAMQVITDLVRQTIAPLDTNETRHFLFELESRIADMRIGFKPYLHETA